MFRFPKIRWASPITDVKRERDVAQAMNREYVRLRDEAEARAARWQYLYEVIAQGIIKNALPPEDSDARQDRSSD